MTTLNVNKINIPHWRIRFPDWIPETETTTKETQANIFLLKENIKVRINGWIHTYGKRRTYNGMKWNILKEKKILEFKKGVNVN